MFVRSKGRGRGKFKCIILIHSWDTKSLLLKFKTDNSLNDFEKALKWTLPIGTSLFIQSQGGASSQINELLLKS